jgi:hypothetical protein
VEIEDSSLLRNLMEGGTARILLLPGSQMTQLRIADTYRQTTAYQKAVFIVLFYH